MVMNIMKMVNLGMLIKKPLIIQIKEGHNKALFDNKKPKLLQDQRKEVDINRVWQTITIVQSISKVKVKFLSSKVNNLMEKNAIRKDLIRFITRNKRFNSRMNITLNLNWTTVNISMAD
jgi:hypothetical protein